MRLVDILVNTRIESCFRSIARRGSPGLGVFLTGGYPTMGSCVELIHALGRGGADFVEIGIPFSDPLADGISIQYSTHVALSSGVTIRDCLDLCEDARREGLDIPLILMGYYNPILRYGIERFATEAASAGVDGVIVVDLPPEEASDFLEKCRSHGIETIFLIAPTSSDVRIEVVVENARGFLYCVSVAGVTGARKELPEDLSGFLDRVKNKTSLPLAVGFGVSRPDQVADIGIHADAAIVGSALVDLLENTPSAQRAKAAEDFVSTMMGK